jgi:ribosome-associated protein
MDMFCYSNNPLSIKAQKALKTFDFQGFLTFLFITFVISHHKIKTMKNKEQFEFEYALDGHEFVELNILLKTTGIARSSGEADASITKGKVTVNDTVETLKRFKVRSGFTVICNDKVIVVK